MCTLPSFKDFLMAQEKLEEAEECRLMNFKDSLEVSSINDTDDSNNKNVSMSNDGKILPRLETPERKNKNGKVGTVESSDSACNVYEVDSSLASMHSVIKRTDSVDSESQKSEKSDFSQKSSVSNKSSTSAATIADSIDNSISSSKASQNNSHHHQTSSSSSIVEIEELLLNSACLEASDEIGDSSSLNQSENQSETLSEQIISDKSLNTEHQMLIDLEHRSKLRKLIQPETLKALLPILLDIGVVRAKQVWTLMNHQNEELKIKELEGILGLVEDTAMESNNELREILELCSNSSGVNTTIKRNKLGVGLNTSSSSDDEVEKHRFRNKIKNDINDRQLNDVFDKKDKVGIHTSQETAKSSSLLQSSKYTK